MLPKQLANTFPTLTDFFVNSNKFDSSNKYWLEGIEIWLSMQTRSDSTHRCYLKESERFLLWCVYINKKPFNQLEIKDVQQYSYFITNVGNLNPDWCGPRKPRQHSNWKPFVGNLSACSHDTAITILQTMFEWLVSDNRVNKNPFKLLINSKKQKKKQLDIANAFTTQEIEIILNYVENYPVKTIEQKRIKARDKWVFNLLVRTGLRSNEIVNTKYKAITIIDGIYYLTITGKGNKERVIPFNSKLISLMKDYRQYFGLSPYPSLNDSKNLVFSVRGFTQLTNKALYVSITNTLKQCAETVEDIYLKEKLLKASPHWLRGTFATLLVENTDVDHTTLQNLMGHSSYNTTVRYVRVSDKRAYEAVNGINI